MSRTVMVTGAGRGIGLELCRQLAASGDSVIACVRDPRSAAPLQGIASDVVSLDVTSAASRAAAAALLRGRPIDVLINNAGVSSTSTSLGTLDLDEVSRVFQVNSVGPLAVSQLLLSNLRAGKSKLVVNMTSQLGSITNNKGGSSYAYRASKAALNMLTVCQARELEREGFICVAIHPGWVRTDMGGPHAPLSVEQSARAILSTMNALTPDKSGSFLNYDGATLPW
ncbi:MAG: SDR family oxidoreductase [Planctomycetota bacterium]|nr:SDR family oxidoreductase [Planctomycetota bacterium]